MWVNARTRGACAGLEAMRDKMEKSRECRKTVRLASEERRPIRDNGREIRQKVVRSAVVERWEWIRIQISDGSSGCILVLVMSPKVVDDERLRQSFKVESSDGCPDGVGGGTE